jgi:uncharacterized protein YbjQ (UPF0145 family)
MKRAITIGAFALLGVALQANAADNIVQVPLQDVLNAPEAKDAGIDGSVRFYLAGAETPAGVQRMGDDIANKKTNAVGKSDQTSCTRAMLSVLLAFQQSAKRKGANAVVDMVSYYKRNEARNPTTFECHVGSLMTSVAMKGTYAKVR